MTPFVGRTDNVNPDFLNCRIIQQRVVGRMNGREAAHGLLKVPLAATAGRGDRLFGTRSTLRTKTLKVCAKRLTRRSQSAMV